MITVNLLKAAFSVLFLFMVYVVVTTSYESNLFDLIRTWDPDNPMAPWFSATLWDFYANVAFIALWVGYKEQSLGKILLWIALLVCLGSIATAGYLLVQLFKLKPGDGLDNLFAARRKT